MKSTLVFARPGRRPKVWWVAGAMLALLPSPAHASLFEGETLDKICDVMSWIVLFLAPVIGIVIFLLIHILPEKIAEKRQHPQAGAIQCLCLLSLVFGGLLWPIAWLWAYSKPVLYKMAYGTDKVAHGETAATSAPTPPETEEIRRLRQRVRELEARVGGAEGEKA
jgi:CBS domain containing-hemolysin-like protein